MYSDKFKQLQQNLNFNIRPNMYSGWWKLTTPSGHDLKTRLVHTTLNILIFLQYKFIKDKPLFKGKIVCEDTAKKTFRVSLVQVSRCI